MAAMVAMGSNSSASVGTQVSSSVSIQEKENRNKRKFRADPPLGDPNKLQIEYPSFEYPSFDFSAEKFQNTQSPDQHGVCDLCNLNKDLVGHKEELEGEEFEDADWSDLNESQLEELLLSNLDAIFKSAIKKIGACGYSEKVATKAVLRSGICYGCKDTVSNIVDNSLAYLKNGRESDTSREHFFENLEQLEKYLLAEMVCVLREVRPFFSIGDAMWWLLMCDMNVSHACVMDGDLLSNFGNDEANNCEPNLTIPCKTNPSTTLPHSSQSETPTISGIPNLPNPRNPIVLQGLASEKVIQIPKGEHRHTTYQPSSLEEKSGGGRKGHSSISKRESNLRHKSLHVEKSYRTYASKSSLKLGKLGHLGGLILDKKQKSVFGSSNVGPKSAPFKACKAVGVNMSQTDENHNVGLSTTPFTFNPKTVNTSLPSNSNTASKPPSSDFDALNYRFSGIPYDNTLEPWVLDDKDMMILKLTPRVQELQNQLQEWTEWANQKVMQAARRLSKDKAELKTLKQEKKEVLRLKTEKQSLDDNTMKKLTEMENALCKANGQVEHASFAVRKLQVENSRLRQQMEVAKLRAAESAASCQEVSKREKTNLKEFHLWEKQKTLFKEELVTEKRKLAQLQREVEQAKDFQDQLEDKLKQEENAKEELLMLANSIRKEREQIDALAKSKEDMIRLKAENDLQRFKDNIRKLETEISELRLKTDSKIAAFRWGIDGGYEGIHQATHIRDMVGNFLDFLGTGDLKRERECVMCLNEEMSVVFLPCAHQVVCTQCNELHEKQGMKDCPSCRSPIQRRVCVRYGRS